MARIRTIKPQHTQDKELSKISLQAHLLWVLSWCFSDDEGVFEADPLLIKSQLFPRRTDVRIEQIDQWLDQLVKARFIIPFEFQNESYYIHRTFKTHQKIDRPQTSKIPEDLIRRTLYERSTNEQPCIGEESIVKESKGEGADSFKNDSGKNKAEARMPAPEITMPFTGLEFVTSWDHWKTYKKTEFKFQYRSLQSEQAALSELASLSKGNEQTAIAIIMQSMAKGWKGFFELKNGQNGSKQTTGGAVNTGSAFAKIDSMPG